MNRPAILRIPRNTGEQEALAENEFYFVVVMDATTVVPVINAKIRQPTGAGIGCEGEVFNEKHFIKELKKHKIEIHEIYEVIPFGKDLAAGRKFINEFRPLEYAVNLARKKDNDGL